MRQPRLLQPHGDAFYHCVSRVVDRRRILCEEERRYLHSWMRRLEAFSGLQIITYCLMSNHFHILVKVPDRATLAPLSPASLRRLLPLIYERPQALAIARDLDLAVTADQEGNPAQLDDLLRRFEARRGDLSAFLKDLKQRFSQWFNRRNSRTGTLWESRFKSLLVEPSPHALLTVAAYIDLNPVRAGLVDDPAKFPWCGYAEAEAGSPTARAGIAAALNTLVATPTPPCDWPQAVSQYRLMLFGEGQARAACQITGEPQRIGVTPRQLEEVVARGGKLPLHLALRCRLRHLTDGSALGSTAFVEAIFKANRSRFGPRRKNGARPMRGAAWGDLQTLRDLKVDVFGSPAPPH